MTLSMEQFRERLVDYLYGELEGEDLREFEACLFASAECRRELAALQGTLRTARAELARDQSEVPPARVRTAVLAAAAEAERVREPSRAAAPVTVSAPVSVRKEHAGTWWSWLRTPWLVPTLGVAAAVAIIVLSKEIEPLRLRKHEAEHEAVAHEAPSARAGAAASTPTSAPKNGLSEASPHDETVSPTGEGEQKSVAAAERSSSSAAPRARAPAKGFAVPPAEWAGAGAQPPASPQQTGSGQPAAKKSAQSPQRVSRAVSAEREEAREFEAPAALREDRDDAFGRGAGPADDVAAVGALGRAASAGAPRAPAAMAASRARDGNESADKARRGAPAAPPPPLAEPARTASESADQAPHGAAAAPVPALGADALLRRAQEHAAAQRFREAASDYRALLQRYPNDARVPAWRKLLLVAATAARDGGAR